MKGPVHHLKDPVCFKLFLNVFIQKWKASYTRNKLSGTIFIESMDFKNQATLT